MFVRLSALALAFLVALPSRADGGVRVPIGTSADWYATFGGSWRERFEWTRWPGFGSQEREDDGQWLHRVYGNAALQLGPHLRVATSVASALEAGRANGPRPTDVDRLDLHEAFAEGTLPSAGALFDLRVGRQELAYGSSRLVSIRQSPNVKRSFDAARLRIERGPWRVDALFGKPVEVDTGVFDDGDIGAQSLLGVYAVRAFGELALDLYYLGMRNGNAAYDRGEASAMRHSFGARFSGQRGALDFDWEAVGQVGHFGGDAIRAWTVASNTGWRFETLPFQPRLGLGGDVASGDGGRGALGTFDALYPRGTYFGEAAVIGPQNLIDVRPSVEVLLRPDVLVHVEGGWFWRESLDDGVYSGSGVLIRSTEPDARARAIATRVGVRVEWTPRTWCTVAAVWERWHAEAFLAETGPAKDLDFVAAWFELSL